MVAFAGVYIYKNGKKVNLTSPAKTPENIPAKPAEEVKKVLHYCAGYKVLSDGTLKNMTKEQLIETVRYLEHNWACAEECNQRQYNLLMQRELYGNDDASKE